MDDEATVYVGIQGSSLSIHIYIYIYTYDHNIKFLTFVPSSSGGNELCWSNQMKGLSCLLNFCINFDKKGLYFSLDST